MNINENENMEAQSSTKDAVTLDSSLKTPEERVALVTKICETTPHEKLSPYYLEIMSTYILDALPKAERLSHTITTSNHQKVISKHETSYQGLAGKLEGGEDALYNLINEIPDKNVYLTKKLTVTQAEIDSNPALKDLVNSIAVVEEQQKAATGRRRFLLKQQLIEMHQDKYIIKTSEKKTVQATNLTKSFNYIDFGENVFLTDKGEVYSDGIVSLYNPLHISALLCNYQTLKNAAAGRFRSDSYYLMLDLDNLIEEVLGNGRNPVLLCLLQRKILGDTNAEIQQELIRRFNIRYSFEYISTLWRQKIPNMLAEAAQDDYIIWYYTNKERGVWKKCSRCGQIKLAHNRFFSKNSSSKDGFYSICKECRRGGGGSVVQKQ